MPYARGDGLARPWIKPGTPGLEHRIGGIEKQPGTGNIDYSPAAHQEMTDTRPPRCSASPTRSPTRTCASAARAPSWRWSAGARPSARSTRRCGGRSPPARTSPTSTSATSGRRPKNLGALLKGFERILVPEMNMGQYKTLLRDQYLVDAQSLTKVSGHPFRIAEIEAAIGREGAVREDRMNVWSMVIIARASSLRSSIWLRPHG